MALHRAVVAQAFELARRSKTRLKAERAAGATNHFDHPLQEIRDRWDAYLRFASQHPRAFALMNAGLTSGEPLPAPARDSYVAPLQSLRALSATQPLRYSAERCAELLRAVAHGAACLRAASGIQVSASLSRTLREITIAGLLKARPAEPRSQRI